MLKAALVGCGARGSRTYVPVIDKLQELLQLVAVCDSEMARAESVARPRRIRAFDNLDRCLEEVEFDLAIVAVTPPPGPANYTVTLRCIEAGKHVVCETPLADTAEQAAQLVRASRAGALTVAVAENYWRTPMLRLKRLLFLADVFGAVHVVYADFWGHGYHGISALRSHIGFDVPVRRVTGFTQEYSVVPHCYRQGEPWRDRESWQFGVLDFANGSKGIFSFSTLSYGSPLRWNRELCSIRFHAAKGMGVADRWAVLDEDGEHTRPILVKQQLANVQGVETIEALIPDLPNSPAWENPLSRYPLLSGDQHSELTVGLMMWDACRSITDGTRLEYGVAQAYADRLLDLAISESWSNDGGPVAIPELGAP